MSTTIEDRVILLLRDQSGDAPAEQAPGVALKVRSLRTGATAERLGGHGFWERLAERTGVASKRWRKVYAREQRVTSDMLEPFAKLFPQHAFWLATGITDATNGHVAPMTAQTFPERLHQESAVTDAYFHMSLTLARRLFEEGHVDTREDKERLYAAERTRPLAHWHDSPLADAAYRIARSEEYETFKQLWQERETEHATRHRHITGQARPSSKKRQAEKAAGLRSTPMLGVDQRTAHQDPWDLFYQPKDGTRTTFALSVMNTPPAELSDTELDALCTWLQAMQEDDLFVFITYLEHHGLPRDEIIAHAAGTDRSSWRGMSQDEIDRFTAQVKTLRRKGRR